MGYRPPKKLKREVAKVFNISDDSVSFAWHGAGSRLVCYIHDNELNSDALKRYLNKSYNIEYINDFR